MTAGAKWIKSSYSEASANNCVEVSALGGSIAVRDSKVPARTFTLTRAAFTALVKSL